MPSEDEPGVDNERFYRKVAENLGCLWINNHDHHDHGYLLWADDNRVHLTMIVSPDGYLELTNIWAKKQKQGRGSEVIGAIKEILESEFPYDAMIAATWVEAPDFFAKLGFMRDASDPVLDEDFATWWWTPSLSSAEKH